MMGRIKILQVITGLDRGGAERMLLDLVAALDSTRFDVRIVSLSKNLTALDAYGHSDMDVDIFDLKNSPTQEIIRLRKFVHGFQPDIIHAHMFHAMVASAVVNSLRRSPAALCFTSHTTRQPVWRKIIIKVLKKRRTVDVAFAAGHERELSAARTIVIPNGVPVGAAKPLRKPWLVGKTLRFVSVGRLIELKDCLGLVKSFAVADIPGAVLEFVGTGPMENDIRVLVAKLGLAERVHLLGFQTNIRAVLKKADIFVMHSQWEGMPMALLEAGAEALPVVSTPVGAIPDVLGDDRGILAAPPDFAEAMKRLAASPIRAIEMGQRLRAHIVENCSITAMTLAHERLYEETWADQNSGRETKNC